MSDQVVDDPEACCGNCPYRRVGPDGSSVCIFDPPREFMIPTSVAALSKEQQLRLPTETLKAGVVMVFQPRFPRVSDEGVCGQHPLFMDEKEERPLDS